MSILFFCGNIAVTRNIAYTCTEGKEEVSRNKVENILSSVNVPISFAKCAINFYRPEQKLSILISDLRRLLVNPETRG